MSACDKENHDTCSNDVWDKDDVPYARFRFLPRPDDE